MMVGKACTQQAHCLLLPKNFRSHYLMMMMAPVPRGQFFLNSTVPLVLCIQFFFRKIMCSGFLNCFAPSLFRRQRNFKVVLKFASRADLHRLALFLAGRHPEAPQEALQVLDIVLRELPSAR
jgi:hypothetical protein